MGKKYLIGICGYLDTQNTIANGQTLRTLTITRQLQAEVGDQNVCSLDYSGWRKKPFSVLLGFCKLICFSKSVIVFPDERALCFIAPMAAVLGKILKTKRYYVVIGGWLPKFLNKHFFIKKALRRFDGVFVQTKILQNALIAHGIKSLVLANFRILSDRICSVSGSSDAPLKTFYLSRIEEQKGVAEMIEVIKKINVTKLQCTLDIYGPIQPDFRKKWEKIEARLPTYIRYGGVLGSEKINHTIARYDLQLFPTKYRTEGFPGAILDSFYAGVPVLAAEWDSGREIINEGSDGILFQFENYADMRSKLNIIIKNRSLLNDLKAGSRMRGDQYSAHDCIQNLLAIILN